MADSQIDDVVGHVHYNDPLYNEDIFAEEKVLLHNTHKN